MKATSFLVSAVQAADGGVMVWGTSWHTLNWASFKCHSDTVRTWSNTVDHVQQCIHQMMAAFTMMTFHVTKLWNTFYIHQISVWCCHRNMNQNLWYFQQLDNSITLWIKVLYQTKWQVSESGDACSISLVMKSQKFDSVLDFPWEECFIQMRKLEIKTVCLFVVCFVFLHHIVNLFLLSSIDYKLYTRWV